MENERDLPFTGSFSKYPQQQGWGCPDAESHHGAIQVSHEGCRNPSIWVIICCFLGYFFFFLSRNWVSVGLTATRTQTFWYGCHCLQSSASALLRNSSSLPGNADAAGQGPFFQTTAVINPGSRCNSSWNRNHFKMQEAYQIKHDYFNLIFRQLNQF